MAGHMQAALWLTQFHCVGDHVWVSYYRDMTANTDLLKFAVIHVLWHQTQSHELPLWQNDQFKKCSLLLVIPGRWSIPQRRAKDNYLKGVLHSAEQGKDVI